MSSGAGAPLSLTGRTASAEGRGETLLVVRLESGRYALPLASVSELAECGALRAVPLAPGWVLGLAERHGKIVTVLDLARILGGASKPGPRCLVRLAPPLDHLALAVPAAPWTVSLAEAPERLGTRAEGDREGDIVLLDPGSLLAAAEPAAFGAPRRR